MTPNPSLKAPTRYGKHRLAAPGHNENCPSAASRRLPPRIGLARTLGMPKHPLLAKLADWFTGPPRFNAAPRDGDLVHRIRLLRPEDYSSCEEIYRLNEAKHFPSGFSEHFASTLRSPAHVFLVAEINGSARGVAGFSMVPTLSYCATFLAYGMVHPDFKGHGLGTNLLFARLAALPESHTPCTVLLTSVGGSNSFYKRFGFRFVEIPAKLNEHGFDHYRVHFTLGDKIRCENALSCAHVEREEIRLATEAARVAVFTQAVAAAGHA
jgi:ribosomal protein S18 acetylase RimI-like enzyme